MIRKSKRNQRRVLPALEGQFERLQHIWGRLAGAPSVHPQNNAHYTRNGLLVGAGVGLATLILFLGRAERQKRDKS